MFLPTAYDKNPLHHQNNDEEINNPKLAVIKHSQTIIDTLHFIGKLSKLFYWPIRLIMIRAFAKVKRR